MLESSIGASFGGYATGSDMGKSPRERVELVSSMLGQSNCTARLPSTKHSHDKPQSVKETGQRRRRSLVDSNV